MKTLGKIIGGILLFLVVALVVLRIVSVQPRNNKPGLWLKGDLVTRAVTDWSFTDKYPTIEVQTRTWYMIPHSVTVTCISANGQLYLTSGYRAGLQYPNGRGWNANVARDPHVRLKIGNQLYDGVVTYLVTDPAETAVVTEAKVKKYPPYGNFINPNRKPAPDATTVLLRVISD
jgi:hypothetical protein